MSVTHIHEIIRVQSSQRKELNPPGRQSFMATASLLLFILCLNCVQPSLEYTNVKSQIAWKTKLQIDQKNKGFLSLVLLDSSSSTDYMYISW